MEVHTGVAWLFMAVSVSSASIQFIGHSQVAYTDSYGHENLLIWGGYDIIDRFLHYDINEQVDGLYTKHLEFNCEVYRLNLSNPSIGWEQLNVVSGEKPAGRILHTMTLSPDQSAFTIFGGTQCFREESLLFGYALKGVWRFNISTQTWGNLIPEGALPDSFDECKR
mmetsp:Transcript_8895/g.13281  ORF Transcript_8895/g.13281 Transcript_8895/m.13281 type:complete len:167 (-) Transcript_8895:88-588(-)